MNDILMECGCRAGATCHSTHYGLLPMHPCCPVHASSQAACTPAKTTPDLSGRLARCYCNKVEPSSLSLAFFEFLGEGSPESREKCGTCGYYEIAHLRKREGQPLPQVCNTFIPKGPQDHDRYYCGHAGWD